MPKAIISNRIYIGELTDTQLKNITDLLTYKIQVRGAERSKTGKITPTTKIEYIRNYKLLPKGIITIPAARTDLIPEGYEVLDKRVLEEVPFPTPRIPLRPLQQEIYD